MRCTATGAAPARSRRRTCRPPTSARACEQWAAFARPGAGATQVAGLLGVSPAEDPGQPVRLALAPAADDAALGLRRGGAGSGAGSLACLLRPGGSGCCRCPVYTEVAYAQPAPAPAPAAPVQVAAAAPAEAAPAWVPTAQAYEPAPGRAPLADVAEAVAQQSEAPAARARSRAGPDPICRRRPLAGRSRRRP